MMTDESQLDILSLESFLGDETHESNMAEYIIRCLQKLIVQV
jgi:hypothetical protein